MNTELTTLRVKEIFKALKSQLDGVQSFHTEKKSLYEGDYAAQVLSIIKNPSIRNLVESRLSWGRVGVDSTVQVTQFDAFDNDTFGATKLLINCNGDNAVMSARRNSLIGACSFVAIIPRQNALPILVPYTGAEATGMKELRGEELQYGIAVKTVKSGTATEYFFFSVGEIFITDAEGEVLDYVKLPVPVMPMIAYTNDADLATKIFGRSLLNKPFKSAFETNLNVMALLEQAGMGNVLRSDIMIVNGQESDFSSGRIEGAIDSLNVFYNKNFNGQGGATIQERAGVSTEGLLDLYKLSLYQCATSLGVHPKALEGETDDTFSPVIAARRDVARDSFAASTKLLARTLYQLVTETPEVDFTPLEVVYRENFNAENVGRLGDAFSKLRQEGFELPESFMKRQFGIPLRAAVLEQQYPDVNLARTMNKNYEALRSIVDDELEEMALPNFEVA